MRSSTRPNNLLVFLLAFSLTLFLASLLNVAFGQAAGGDGIAFGDGPTPISDLRMVFTPEVIVALSFVVTAALTALFKFLGGTQGVATVIASAVSNALVKVVIPLIAGAVTLPVALAMFVLGMMLDEGIYRLLTQTSAKGVRLEEPVLATSTVKPIDGSPPVA